MQAKEFAAKDQLEGSRNSRRPATIAKAGRAEASPYRSPPIRGATRSPTNHSIKSDLVGQPEWPIM